MLRLSLLGLSPFLLLVSGCARPVVAQSPTRPQVLPRVPSFPRQEPPPPELPQVDVFGDGTLRTDGVNRITAHARVGAVEWLGTLQGLKRIDTRTGAVRYITRRDGLPGDYIEAVVADANGVFVLVRDARNPLQVFLGTLHEKNLRWKPLAEHTARGRFHLALSPSAVVLAPPQVVWHEERFATMVERRRLTVRTLPWDAALRADFDQVPLTFAHLRGETLWLGSDLGLLSVNLTGMPHWRRFLPEHALDAGAWSNDGHLWLVSHARAGAKPASVLREWSPTTQTQRVEAPLPPAENERSCTLAWSPQGVWITRTRREGPLHFDQSGHRTADVGTPPEAALLPLALTVIDPFPQTTRYPDSSFTNQPDYWLFKHFPKWVTSSASTRPVAPNTVPKEQWARFGRLIDQGKVWLSEGNNLLHVPLDDVGPIQGERGSYGLGRVLRERAEVYPVFLTAQKTGLPLGKLLTLGNHELAALTGQGLFVTEKNTWQKISAPEELDYSNHSAVVAGRQGTLFVRSSTGVLHLKPKSRTLVPLPESNTSAYLLKAGTPQGLLFQESHSVLHLLPLNEADLPSGPLQRIELKYPGDPPSPMVFWAAAGSTLWCSGSLPGKPEVVVGYDLESGRWTTPHALTDRGIGGGNPFTMLHGEVYCASESDQGALLHYDTRAARWTALVPPVPKKTSQGLGLLALTEQEALFADRHRALRFDRTTRQWSELTVSEGLRLSAAAPFEHPVALRNGVCYIGGEKGLWRYHPDSHHWEEVKASVSEGDKLFLHLRSVDSTAVWGEVQGQGNPAPRFTFRFDKRAHTFQLFGEDAGIPSDYSYQQVSDNGGYWFLTNHGAWRLDSKAGTCRRITAEALAQLVPDPYNPQAVYLLSRQGARLQRFDTRTGQLKTLTGPSLSLATALLVERNQLVVCADTRLFTVAKGSGAWKPLALPADKPPLAAHTLQRTKSGSLLLRDYSGQNQVEVK